MKPSSAGKKISRIKARNAALLNQLATPGLGTLMAGRWVTGILQLLLSLAGFVLVLIWFVMMMASYYGQMFGNETTQKAANFNHLILGAVIFAVAWGWALATSLSLLRGVSKVSLESLESFAAGQVKLDEARIILGLSALPQWRREEQTISRSYEFADFVAAMKFVNAVASLAEQAQHHPDIDVRWNKVTLALSTHDAGGLTQKDFALARQCDSLAAA